MAYDKKKIFERAKEIVVKKKLYFIEDIIAFLPISKPTFYDFFKPESNELNEIKGLLENNKIETKAAMFSKWYQSDAPALQMALMKLICTDEQRKKLSMTYSENQVDLKTNISELKLPKYLEKPKK